MTLALITGGAGGIGGSIVGRLADAGMSVAFSYHSHDEASEKRVEDLRARGVKVKAFKADLSEAGGPDELWRAVVEWGGSPDILVNNAGLAIETPMGAGIEAPLRRMLEVNLVSAMRLCELAGGAMAPGGAIVNISSINATRPSPRVSAYAASKAALEAATKALAAEFGPRGIRVNAISPGLIESPARPRAGALRDRIFRETPLGRIGAPDDVADVACYLASPEAGFVTGQVVAVTGGWR